MMDKSLIIENVKEIIDNFTFNGEKMDGVYKDCLLQVIEILEKESKI